MYIRSPKELALLVVNQRKKLKLSQSEVGKLVGLKQQTVSNFENHPDGTKLNTIFSILSAVQIDINAERKDEAKAKWKEEW